MILSLSLALTSTLPAVAPVVDWPKFQGPNGDGTGSLVSDEFDWSEGGPEILWTLEIGGGYGGTAIEGGEVFFLDREAGEADILRCLDLETGEQKWSAGYPAPGRLNFPGSRTVPTVVGRHVYTAGGFGHVTCFDRETHEIVWQHDLEEVYGGLLPMFGWSAAPLVVGDLVITTPLGEEVGLVAFDRESGDEEWIVEGIGFSHSTPVLLELFGESQVVFLSTSYQTSGQDAAAPLQVSSFDPDDGTLLWRHETELSRLPIPGPVKVADNRLFLTGGYRGGSTLLEITKDGDDYGFEELFHIERGAQIHQPILVDEHIYVLVNENWNDSRSRRKEGGLLCLSQEGEEVWRTGNEPNFGRGNMIYAGGYLLIQDGNNGVLRVVEPTTAGFELVAEANVFEMDDERDKQMWAPMSLSQGLLVMRSQDEMRCVRL